jgi:hypothetical protein
MINNKKRKILFIFEKKTQFLFFFLHKFFKLNIASKGESCIGSLNFGILLLFESVAELSLLMFTLNKLMKLRNFGYALVNTKTHFAEFPFAIQVN